MQLFQALASFSPWDGRPAFHRRPGRLRQAMHLVMDYRHWTRWCMTTNHWHSEGKQKNNTSMSKYLCINHLQAKIYRIYREDGNGATRGCEEGHTGLVNAAPWDIVGATTWRAGLDRGYAAWWEGRGRRGQGCYVLLRCACRSLRGRLERTADVLEGKACCWPACVWNQHAIVSRFWQKWTRTGVVKTCVRKGLSAKDLDCFWYFGTRSGSIKAPRGTTVHAFDWLDLSPNTSNNYGVLGGGFKCFLFSPLFREDFQFD